MKSKQPVLLVMAAGMGTRYGGLKQMDPLGPGGEILMDYSVYDAMRAGFSKVIFVIRRDFEGPFDTRVKAKLQGRLSYGYAYQELDDLPDGFSPPQGRVKPWGTGHAVLAARDLIQGPVAVINADDYYGPEAFRTIYAFLQESQGTGSPRIGLCTWRLGDTLSENGQVSRGVCLTQGDRLLKIEEMHQIEAQGDKVRASRDQGRSYQDLDGDLPVSMNFWGFPLSFIDLLAENFPDFLKAAAQDQDLTAEYPLPVIVGQELAAGRIEAVAMPVSDRWYGVTNRADKPQVAAALAALSDKGLYPHPLWD